MRISEFVRKAFAEMVTSFHIIRYDKIERLDSINDAHHTSVSLGRVRKELGTTHLLFKCCPG